MKKFMTASTIVAGAMTALAGAAQAERAVDPAAALTGVESQGKAPVAGSFRTAGNSSSNGSSNSSSNGSSNSSSNGSSNSSSNSSSNGSSNSSSNGSSNGSSNSSGDR